MIMEYWVGWFDTWGGKHMVKDADGKCFSVFGPSRGAPGHGSFTHFPASPSAHSTTTVHSAHGPDGVVARPGGALVNKNDLSYPRELVF